MQEREQLMRWSHSAVGAILLGAGLLGPPSALAHHSFAMFDVRNEVTVSGTVREFQWTNPHSWLQLNVQRDGKTVEYSIELGSPNTMSRRGWRRTSFKPGDRVTVTMNPMRDGSPGGSLISAIDAQGNRLSMR
jgi:hypothetical protein